MINKKLINNIKTVLDNKTTNAVLLRELYLGLGLHEATYKRWVNTNIIKNEFFIQGRDWEIYSLNQELSKGNFAQDYIISLDFAKHISMMAKTIKAHEYRNYFINLEKTFEYIKFRSLDKQHQLNSMELIHDILSEEEKKVAVNYIKANTVVNKITSDIHKHPKMIKKDQMNQEELVTRQKVLDDYVKAFELTNENGLTNDVLRTVYKKQDLLK